jgi:UDP-glucose:(heptosyl)LPS alpha-1,3-glucosyltransferase
VIGFNKMPGLDVYYCADPCYEDKARTLRGPVYRLSGATAISPPSSGRCSPREGRNRILMISAAAAAAVREALRHPGTRFHLLPPGIAADRRAPAGCRR